MSALFMSVGVANLVGALGLVVCEAIRVHYGLHSTVGQALRRDSVGGGVNPAEFLYIFLLLVTGAFGIHTALRRRQPNLLITHQILTLLTIFWLVYYVINLSYAMRLLFVPGVSTALQPGDRDCTLTIGGGVIKCGYLIVGEFVIATLLFFANIAPAVRICMVHSRHEEPGPYHPRKGGYENGYAGSGDPYYRGAYTMRPPANPYYR